MANYNIQYSPDSNIINIDDYNTQNNTAIIFYYMILRCEGHAEVRIWCDQCSLKECIYTCAVDKSDAEIVAEVNEILDGAIDCYMYEFFSDSNEDEDAYCNNRNMQDTMWRD